MSNASTQNSGRNVKLRGADAKGADSAPRPGEELARSWLLAGCTTLLSARVFIAGDLGASLGEGLMLVMLWILLGVVWGISAIRAGSLRIRFTTSDALTLGFFAVVALASLYQFRESAPRPAVNVLWEWISLALAYFLVRQAIGSAADARAVLACLVALATALAALGYFQFTVDRWETINRYEAIKNDPLQMMKETGHWSPPNSVERKRFEDRLRSSEPFARFALANSLAGFLAPGLVLAMGIGLSSLRGKRPNWTSWVSFALAAFLLGCLLLTKSRSAVLAVVCGVGMLWWLNRQRGKSRWLWPSAAGALALLCVVSAWLAGGLDREVFSQAGRSLAFRLQYWQSTARLIADHPLLGVGVGQFGLSYTKYKLPEASEEITDPHNVYLEAAAVAGLPALFVFVGALGWIGVRLYRNPWKSALPEVSPTEAMRGSYRFACGGAIAGLFLGLLVSLSAGIPLPARSFILLLSALLVALVALAPWIRTGRLPPALVLVALIVLLVNLLAAGSLWYPAVAGALWLLVAVGASLTDGKRSQRSYPPHLAYVLSALGLLLGLICYLTAYYPGVASAEYLSQSLAAQERGDPVAAERNLAAAVAVDAHSSRLAQRLADFRYRIRSAEPNLAETVAIERAMALARERSPRDAALLNEQGRIYLGLFEHTQNPEYLALAETYFRDGLARYPTSIRLRASLALTLASRSAMSEARAEAHLAFRLEATALQAGHEDKRIPNELRQQLLRIIESSN